jgi:hypothetical protein
VLNDVERIGGTFTVNWHDRSIAPDRLWDTFYLDLVRELQRRRAWFATGSKAVAWFRKRRAAVLDTIQMDRGMMRIRGVIEEVDSLPALRIRIHKPRTRPLDEPLAPEALGQSVDMPFKSSMELNFAL